MSKPYNSWADTQIILFLPHSNTNLYSQKMNSSQLLLTCLSSYSLSVFVSESGLISCCFVSANGASATLSRSPSLPHSCPGDSWPFHPPAPIPDLQLTGYFCPVLEWFTIAAPGWVNHSFLHSHCADIHLHFTSSLSFIPSTALTWVIGLGDSFPRRV